ncbi:MAG: hypothetical protein Fues2KO_48230 [Fuerstiella sp.]
MTGPLFRRLLLTIVAVCVLMLLSWPAVALSAGPALEEAAGGSDTGPNDDAAPVSSAITDLGWTTDGGQLVVATANRIELRHWPSLKVARTISTPLSRVFSFQIMTDAKCVCAGGRPGEQGQLAMLDLNSGDVLWHQSIREDVAYQIAISETHIYAALHDQSVAVLAADDGRLLDVWTGQSKPVTTVLRLDDELILSAGLDQTIRVRQADSGEIRRSLNNHTRAVTDLALRPDSNGLPMVASVSEDRTIRFWQPTIGRLVRFKRLPSAADCVAFSADGSIAFCGARDGNVYAVEVDTLETRTIPSDVKGRINGLAIHPNGKQAVLGDSNGQLATIDLTSP